MWNPYYSEYLRYTHIDITNCFHGISLKCRLRRRVSTVCGANMPFIRF